MLAAGSFGINVEISPYASFVNLLQVTGRYNDYNSETSLSAGLNSSGDPESDTSLIFDYRVNQIFDGPDPDATPPDLSGTYHLSFHGLATIQNTFPETTTPFTVQGQTYDPSTNTTTANLVVPAGTTEDLFVISFLDTQASSTSATNTGFSNAKLIRPGYADDSTQVYTNEFVSALKPYTVLRYLDPDNANGQPFFHNNTLLTVDAPQVDQTGMPWEDLVALANQTNTDMWINVPEGATDAYVAALAGIIKDGGTVDGVAYSGLNPDLKIYLEYSNEVWGGIPFNEYYQIACVQDEADNQPLSTFPGNQHVYDNLGGASTTDYNVAVGRRYLERTAEIGQIFQQVMGADPTHQRIRPVLGWQENDSSFYTSALTWFQDYFGPADAAFYGLGDANYFSPADDSSVDAVLSSLSAQEASAMASTVAYTTIAKSYGLKNVSYEGGPAISGDGSDSGDAVALAASRDPRIEQVVERHYLDFFAAGGDLAEYYDGPFAIWSPYYSWSDAELSQYEDPSASPKYRGTVDVAADPPPAITVGIAIAAAGQTRFDATSDTLGEDFSAPTTGQQDDWLVNVASSGTYDLTLTTSAVGGVEPGRVQVLVDGKPVGGVVDVSAASTVDLGPLVLPAGLSAISLLVVRGSGDPSQQDGTYYQFEPLELTLTAPASRFSIADPGFESVNVGTGYAYNPTGSSWTFSGSSPSGSGLTGNGSAFTYANPAAPQGSQVAFLQEVGTIAQSVADWAAGSYTISFDAAQRAAYSGAGEDFEVLVDGNVVGTFKPSTTTYLAYTTSSFTVAAGAHTIEFLGLDSAGGDNTAFLDAISVALATPPINSTTPTVGDPGFEAVNVGSGFAYAPANSAWTFSGGVNNGSGLTGNNSAFTYANPAAPQGSQVAFLQATGTITQSVAGWAAGSYTLSFDAAQRAAYNGSGEDFEVLVDGHVVGTFKPSTTTYLAYTTSSFTVAAGAHTIEFLGLDSGGGDNTAFLDAVSVALATPPSNTPTVGDAGFESIAIGTGYAYNPTGSSWTFSGSSPSGSGVAGNNSAFTYANPAAPQGTQVAFLQEKGSITQSVAGWAAGSYTLSFDAAQRAANNTAGEDFEVLIDQVVVATFQPTTTSYQLYMTSVFKVSAGSHVIQFLGLDGAGGDNTVFLDGVSVANASQ